jgi:histidinol-phosphatase (PHP family)
MGWRASLHGGHSGAYCDHAEGSLEEVVAEAARQGFEVYGLSEHAPRNEERWLYPREIALGWGPDRLSQNFAAYAVESARLQAAYAGRLTVVRGFESEMLPGDRWAEQMTGLRRLYGFEYMVGSVHTLGDHYLDMSEELFLRAAESFGGLEGLVVRYYEAVAELVQRLRPEVVGHLDLVRRFGEAIGLPDTARTRAAEDDALVSIAEAGSILDLNTAALRKGLATPYPAPPLLLRAQAMGIGCCLGDDSHGPSLVGSGLEEGRAYLLGLGIRRQTILWPAGGGEVERRFLPLD